MAASRPAAVAGAMDRTPLTFVAFDVLWLDGDAIQEPYEHRRTLLEGLEGLEGLEVAGEHWCTASTFPGAGAELFAACTAMGLEG
jgi:bifunctional non-homologous end joining protein LigD